MGVRVRPATGYREVRSELVDQIPMHWSIRRNKHLFQLRHEIVGEDSGRWRLLSLTKKGVKERNIDSNFGKFPASFDTYQGVHPSDLVFCLFDIDETPRSVGLSPFTGMVTGAYSVYRCCEKVDPRYVYWFYLHIDQRKGLRPFYTGLRKVVRPETFGNIEMPVPPLPTQKAIADFLDRKTAAIDALIEKKQKLLALLAEKRAALIHNVLDMPGCRRLRLGVVADRVQRPIERIDEDVYRPVGLYNRGRGIFHKEPTRGIDLGDSDFFWIKSDDLILSGQFAWEGAVALAGPEDAGCVVTHRYPILRGKPDMLNTAYLLAFLQTKTGDFLLNEHSRGAAGRNRPLNAGTLSKEKIPVPPMEAQAQISNLVYLEKRLRKTIAEYSKRLQEYRQALITAAVTGQLDIGEAA